MITDVTQVFPNNVVTILANRISELDADLVVLKRPLRKNDPNQCVGIIGMNWMPENDSFEMRGLPSAHRSEPTLGCYLIGIQAFVRDGDEERGLATHSVLSKMIRTMLYRNEDLRLDFAALSVSMGGSIERSQRWGVRTQRFMSNEISGAFLYLSTIEFFFDTETV